MTRLAEMIGIQITANLTQQRLSDPLTIRSRGRQVPDLHKDRF